MNKNFVNPTDLIGKSVRVYRNLQRNCWSVQHKGLVVAHATFVRLKNARFIVNQSGYERFLREKRKNVHAFVCGELVSLDEPTSEFSGTEVVYNPRVSNLFHTVSKCFKGREYFFSEQEVLKQAFCCGKTVFVSNNEISTGKQ
jgi:hypothetical protein